MNNTTSASTLLNALNWRYATKKFDAARTIPEDQFDTLVEATRLTASSFGLQPYRFIIVRTPELRAQLREYSYGQPQITDASHLIVFATQTDLSPEDTQEYMERIARTRSIPIESLDGFKASINGSLTQRSPEAIFEWSSDQTYIAIGNLLTTAALLGIDACPMEGLQKDKYDDLLGLMPMGYATRAVVALGYRSAEDGLARMAKVRKTREELFLEK